MVRDVLNIETRMRILIAGGTGLIGKALIRRLHSNGFSIVVLSRSPGKFTEFQDVEVIHWDGRTTNGWGGLVKETDAVINLAGENIGRFPWTEKRKQEFRESRVAAGHALVAAIKESARPPRVFIQASAVGYYGPRGAELVDESFDPGTDFSARLCMDWENSTKSIEDMGIRRVIIRTGIVLARKGGIFPQMALPVKLYFGGRMGDGRQGIPWIHMEDEVGAIQFLLENGSARGVYNLSGPAPLSNAEFTKNIASVLKRPYWFHLPKTAVRLLLGEISSLLLNGQFQVPKKILNLGYKFKYQTIEPALLDLIGNQ